MVLLCSWLRQTHCSCSRCGYYHVVTHQNACIACCGGLHSTAHAIGASAAGFVPAQPLCRVATLVRLVLLGSSLAVAVALAVGVQMSAKLTSHYSMQDPHIKMHCYIAQQYTAKASCCTAAAAIDTTPDDAEPTMSTFVDGGIIANNPTMQVHLCCIPLVQSHKRVCPQGS